MFKRFLFIGRNANMVKTSLGTFLFEINFFGFGKENQAFFFKKKAFSNVVKTLFLKQFYLFESIFSDFRKEND